MDLTVMSEESQSRIDKDVLRTDRTEEFYHPTDTNSEADLNLPNLSSLRRILYAYSAAHPTLGNQCCCVCACY